MSGLEQHAEQSAGGCDVCGEQIIPGSLDDILDHLRNMHPDIYGDGPERWPDGGVVIEIDDSVPASEIQAWARGES